MTPYDIVVSLLDDGIYIASVSSFYRVLREEKLLTHRCNSKRRKSREKPVERKATEINKVWCWDITWLPKTVKGYFFYGYLIIDIYDRTIVGWAVHETESEKLALELFKDTVCRQDVRFEYLHSDNGTPMKGVSLNAFLKNMDVSLSYSRPRVSNDNPFIESFFRTLKYKPEYPQRFRNIEEARDWMANFVNWYNTEHLHSALDYVTPSQVRSGEAENIFNNRNEVMKKAKMKNPERWGSRNLKIWGNPEEVILNKKRRHFC